MLKTYMLFISMLQRARHCSHKCMYTLYVNMYYVHDICIHATQYTCVYTYKLVVQMLSSLYAKNLGILSILGGKHLHHRINW